MSNKDLKLGKWTRERPTAPGWYWWRQDTPINGNKFPRVVEVFDAGGGRLMVASLQPGAFRLDNASGEWCAIPLPEEEGLSYVRHPAFDEYGEHR